MEYGGGPKRLEAVKSGEIKATAGKRAASTSMAREQGVRVLVDLVPERIPWLFTAIVVKKSAIDGQRDVLTRFIKATAEGNRLALTDETRAKSVLAEKANIRDPKSCRSATTTSRRCRRRTFAQPARRPKHHEAISGGEPQRRRLHRHQHPRWIEAIRHSALIPLAHRIVMRRSRLSFLRLAVTWLAPCACTRCKVRRALPDGRSMHITDRGDFR